MEREAYQQLAGRLLSEKRYEHTLAVARLSAELALCHGADAQAAETAGLLHDLMKERPLPKQREQIVRALRKDAEQLQKGGNSAIILDNPSQAEELLSMLSENPNICHSVAGYLYARDELSVTDPDILRAIRNHTAGRAGMSLLEKIVYTADAVAYDRSYPEAEELRTLAFADLEGCMLAVIDFTVAELMRKRRCIALDTLYCYNELCRGKKPL